MKVPEPGRAREAITMRDIARAAHVSQSTVSRVLSGKASTGRIPESTRIRIITIAQELGFRPNPLARGLRGAPTMLLGVVVREVTDPFFSAAVEALSLAAVERNYNVVLGHVHGVTAEASPLQWVLESRACDSVLLLGDMRDLPRFIGDLRQTSVPVIGMWQGKPPQFFPAVNVDNRAGMTAALDHLTKLGHTRIAFVGSRPFGGVLQRALTFWDYMEGRGLKVPSGFVVQGSNEWSVGASAVESLMALPRPPTAIATATDQLAIGVLHRAHELGVRIPDDLSVIGFDDIPMAAYTVPALTTIRNPIPEMARAAVEMVSSASLDHQTEQVFQPSLVVRRSTAPHHARTRARR